MNRGRLVAEDTLDNLRRKLHPQVDLEVELDQAQPNLIKHLADLEFVDEVSDQDNKLSLKTRDHSRLSPPQISQIISAHGGVIVDMRSKEMSLEEAFVTITEQNVSLLTEEAA